MAHDISRRTLLQSVGASLGLGLLPRFLQAQADTREPSTLHLNPVHVSRDRILKTVVGLRPYRKTGYVVRRETLGDKTIVHNYGHGGCGVTLSWGTAALAVKEVLRTKETKIAVLGCGAVGLAAARLLQQRGLQPTIYAREVPPNTCSDIAGARWYPFDLFNFQAVTPEYIASVWQASRVSYDTFMKLDKAKYGIFLRPTYMFQNSPLSPHSLLNFDSPIKDLLPGLRELATAENLLNSRVTRTFQTMMIEPAIYLPAVIQDYKQAGGHIVQREFHSAADLALLPERVVVNCTGLGAATLFGDKELAPIKGQLTILTPQSEVDYVALPLGRYMFPRKDGIVLGGTFERGVSTMSPNLEEETKMLADHTKFFAALQKEGSGKPLRFRSAT